MQRTLLIGVEISWIAAADGARHELGRAHRRIITTLADLHRSSPGAVLSMREIFEAGWPGERPVAEAGANRVYVALAQLRRVGMREIIEREGRGYQLASDVEIRVQHGG